MFLNTENKRPLLLLFFFSSKWTSGNDSIAAKLHYEVFISLQLFVKNKENFWQKYLKYQIMHWRELIKYIFLQILGTKLIGFS